MVRFEPLDDGSCACVLRVLPVGLPHTEARERFDRHVADVRSRHDVGFVTQVRAEWVPYGAPRDDYDLIAAACSTCGRFVLTVPMRKLEDVARLCAFGSVSRLLNGCALFRKEVWRASCFACLETRGLCVERAS